MQSRKKKNCMSKKHEGGSACFTQFRDCPNSTSVVTAKINTENVF